VRLLEHGAEIDNGVDIFVAAGSPAPAKAKMRKRPSALCTWPR
jgi:hypothetical protein